jgi:Flp pilus assembly protein CpaB
MSIASSGIGRPRRGRLYIVIGAILALVAFGTAAGLAYLPSLTSSASGTKVVVAKNNIGARNKILASDIELKVVTPTPPESFTDLTAVAGKGARVDIPAGEPITANLIAQAPDLLSSSDLTYLPIPTGYVATTIPTSEEVGVGGYVQVSDRIIVLATINTATFGASAGVPVVRTVFRDLAVIRVGPATGQPATQSVTSSLTVLMTLCDAEYLFWLLDNAVLKYELESPKDYGATPTQQACPASATGGVGPKDVDTRWHFSAST